MNKFFLMVALLALAGCVSLSEESVSVDSAGSFPKTLRAVSQMQLVQTGMLKGEVRSLLDEKVTIGYEYPQEGQPYTPITLSNPYKLETVKSGSKVFEIYYYFIGTRQADGKVTDDELVPLVFENDRLAGKGWAFVKRSIPKQD